MFKFLEKNSYDQIWHFTSLKRSKPVRIEKKTSKKYSLRFFGIQWEYILTLVSSEKTFVANRG